jgi:hypothetical protein
MDLVYILPSESDIQVLWTLGRWTQSKSTFILIIILHRQNPTEFILTTSMDLVYILPSESDIQVLWNPGRWTQSKSTFILIIILHRQNPTEFTLIFSSCGLSIWTATLSHQRPVI